MDWRDFSDSLHLHRQDKASSGNADAGAPDVLFSGSLVNGVLNMGAPAPIDIRVAGIDVSADYGTAQQIAARVREIAGVTDVYIPQDIDYPSLRIAVDRTRTSELGLTEKEVVSAIIGGLTFSVILTVFLVPAGFLLVYQSKTQQASAS